MNTNWEYLRKRYQEANRDPRAFLYPPAPMEPEQKLAPWLESLAAELDVDLARHVSELNAQDWTPGEIALSMLDCAFPNGTTPESVLRIRCYPWEKSRLVRAAKGEKLNEWMRRHLIRAAMESENED